MENLVNPALPPEPARSLPVITSTVWYLEMTTNPGLPRIPLEGFTLQQVDHLAVEAYLAIYKAVGRDYLWNYRPGQSRAEIAALLAAPETRLYLLYRGTETVGMAELDARDPKNVELVHFGLIPELLHQGIGSRFLQNILSLTWSAGPERIWLSTCGMDHPKAVPFYERAGFTLFKTKQDVEFLDYRFSGFYEMHDAPQIPFGRRRS